MSRWSIAAVSCALVVCVVAIDCSDQPLDVAPCRAIAQFSPASVTLAVAQSVTIATTVEAGCPAPIVRNETPGVIQLDTIAAGSSGVFRVRGLVAGSGRVRVMSAVDSAVSGTLTVTVQ
ncbi:MAG: hypothetical protein JWM41_278 [Gemmatimonadetes bacterium]|nr:hypothetical protein [Gemmatimonadota bacterium]